MFFNSEHRTLCITSLTKCYRSKVWLCRALRRNDNKIIKTLCRLRQTIGIEPESAGWAVLYGLRLSYVEMPETGNTRVSLVSDSRAAVQGFVYLLRPDELKSLDVNFTSIAKVNVITFRHQIYCKNYDLLVEL